MQNLIYNAKKMFQTAKSLINDRHVKEFAIQSVARSGKYIELFSVNNEGRNHKLRILIADYYKWKPCVGDVVLLCVDNTEFAQVHDVSINELQCVQHCDLNRFEMFEGVKLVNPCLSSGKVIGVRSSDVDTVVPILAKRFYIRSLSDTFLRPGKNYGTFMLLPDGKTGFFDCYSIAN